MNNKTLVIILNHNGKSYTDQLYESLNPHKKDIYDLLVMDNGSTIESEKSPYTTLATDQNCYYIFGTLGSLAFPRMELWRYGPGAPAGWQHPIVPSRCAVAGAPPLVSQLEHFCRVIRGEEEPLVDGRDGARSLAVALAVLESAARQQPIELSASL